MLLLFDISEDQTIRNYQKLAKRSGGGYIKATEGGQSQPDKGFTKHWSETREAGLLRGAYHLWCPGFDPKEQARSFHRAVQSAGDLGELPPALCVQVPGNAEDVRQCAEEIERLFARTPLIYTRKSTFGEPVHQAGGSQRPVTRCIQSRRTDQVDGLTGDKTWAGRYPLWFASYISTPRDEPIPWTPDMLEKLARPSLPQKDRLPTTWSKWHIWQFSHSGLGADWGADPSGSQPIGLNLFEGSPEELQSLGRRDGQAAPAQGVPAATKIPSASEAEEIPAEAQVQPAIQKAGGIGKPAGRAFGIDISAWQQTFRPPPEANDLDFVVLKASQANFGDPAFENFYAAASSIPIRGAYHYFITSTVIPADSQPATAVTKAGKDKSEKKSKGDKKAMKAGTQASRPAELPGFTWQEQAEVFLNQVKGKDFAFTALDLESGGGKDPRTKRPILNKYTRQDVQNIRRWVDEVKKGTGKPVLLYTRATVFAPQIMSNGGEILNDIDLWIARYPNDLAASAAGNPYAGDDSVKIPGRGDWRFWQYSDRNNGKGAKYGVKTLSVDLNVYNGTSRELADWLGMPLVPAAVPQLGGVQFGLLETEAPALPEAVQQLQALRDAGLAPNVHLSIQWAGADLAGLKELLEALQAAGIPPQQVHVNLATGWEGHASAGGETGAEGSIQGGEQVGGELIDAGRPDYEGGDEPGFLVEIARKGGKRSILRSFGEKDGSGRPVMEPYGDPQSGDPVTRAAGDLLWVSATDWISDADPGDGRIQGADGKVYYYVTGAPENEDAAGLYVRKKHTRRL